MEKIPTAVFNKPEDPFEQKKKIWKDALPELLPYLKNEEKLRKGYFELIDKKPEEVEKILASVQTLGRVGAKLIRRGYDTLSKHGITLVQNWRGELVTPESIKPDKLQRSDMLYEKIGGVPDEGIVIPSRKEEWEDKGSYEGLDLKEINIASRATDDVYAGERLLYTHQSYLGGMMLRLRNMTDLEEQGTLGPATRTFFEIRQAWDRKMAKLQGVFAYLGYAPKFASDAIKTAKEKASAAVKDIFDSFTKKTEEKEKE